MKPRIIRVDFRIDEDEALAGEQIAKWLRTCDLDAISITVDGNWDFLTFVDKVEVLCE